MKLFHSPSSPYVRKVMACAITRGIEERITLLPTSAHQSPPELLAANPLSKVPCLVTEDGLALFDSPVICEYLDSVTDALWMFPRPGSPARWIALRQQALGDGMLDAAIWRRREGGKPRDAARDAGLSRQLAAIQRSLALLEAEPPHRTVDIGGITIACALGFLDFRFAHENWRQQHPKLAEWFEAFSRNPGLARTTPKEPG